VPAALLQLLDSGDKQTFDRFFDQGMQSATPAERQNWEWRAKPYGLDSPFDVFTAARQYNLTDVVDQITTPLLITAAEGADRHCEPMARSLLEHRMVEWLDETLAAATT
jgi:gamma-glutamyl:cysteine ligase YbdK (ATP-grasp superfamily)